MNRETIQSSVFNMLPLDAKTKQRLYNDIVSGKVDCSIKTCKKQLKEKEKKAKEKKEKEADLAPPPLTRAHTKGTLPASAFKK